MEIESIQEGRIHPGLQKKTIMTCKTYEEKTE